MPTITDILLDALNSKAKTLAEMFSQQGPEFHFQLLMTLPKETLKDFVRCLANIAEVGIDNRENLGDPELSTEMQQAIVAFYDSCDRMLAEITKLTSN